MSELMLEVVKVTAVWLAILTFALPFWHEASLIGKVFVALGAMGLQLAVVLLVL